MLTALPDGPLREQLGPVAGVRALLPVARAVSSVSQLRVLNADDKTVARVVGGPHVGHASRQGADRRPGSR